MRKIIVLFSILFSANLVGCVTTTPQRGIQTTTGTSSVEAEARKKTEEMATKLTLTPTQKDEVMIANTVHLKVLKTLKDNKETDKIPAANESYKGKIKTILTAEQFTKFETEMGG